MRDHLCKRATKRKKEEEGRKDDEEEDRRIEEIRREIEGRERGKQETNERKVKVRRLFEETKGER